MELQASNCTVVDWASSFVCNFSQKTASFLANVKALFMNKCIATDVTGGVYKLASHTGFGSPLALYFSQINSHGARLKIVWLDTCF